MSRLRAACLIEANCIVQQYILPQLRLAIPSCLPLKPLDFLRKFLSVHPKMHPHLCNMDIPSKIPARQHEILVTFLNEIDKHLADIVEERATEMFEIRDIAKIMHIHPTHLSNTIRQSTGNAPCFYFEEKILTIAKEMLSNNEQSIRSIATLLTYDPSNFTKFFKRFTGQTPKAYREAVLSSGTDGKN